MWIVEKKLTRNPIPYEYGFSTKELAEEFKKEVDKDIGWPVRWTDLEEKEKPDWDQYKFIK